MNVKLWFSFDTEDGDYEFWDTEDAASKAAEKYLDFHRDNAGVDGWPEDQTCVGYGRVVALPVRTNIQTRAEWEAARTPEDLEDDPWPGGNDFDEMYNLTLEPVKEAPNGQAR